MQKISFPLGLAEDPYFCNRLAETNQLLRNIEHCTHTVLISPRRYGKTSLAYRGIHKSKLPYACVDFYMTTEPIHIEKAILAGISDVLSQISNRAEMLLSLVKNYVKLLKASFEAGNHGLKIKLESSSKTFSPDNLCEALRILDKVLKKKSIKAVLLIDEFQEIQRIASDQGIEGAIRHVAQDSKNLSLIFSGSHRHLLKSMFNDKNKPLYRLCDEIQLERICEEEYLSFIKKFSSKKWKKTLSDELIQKIFNYSECHTYYVNAICEKLFYKETLPSIADVDDIWNKLILLKKKDILSETKNLNVTQKKLLVAIAHEIDREFTGRVFLSKNQLSGASVIRALEHLEENDFIEKRNDRYQLIDPLLKSIIRQLAYF